MSTKEFLPTFLYIKRHSITGKMYFGKTTRDPEKYLGSGLHWLKHVQVHGTNFVETLWYCLFVDQESLTECAKEFSISHNIVESKDWLNLKIENGLDGGSLKGRTAYNKGKRGIFKHTEDTIKHFSKIRKGVRKSEAHSKNISTALKAINIDHCGKNNPMFNKHHNQCTKELISIKAKNRKHTTCEICGKEVLLCHYTRYHGKKCKLTQN